MRMGELPQVMVRLLGPGAVTLDLCAANGLPPNVLPADPSLPRPIPLAAAGPCRAHDSGPLLGWGIAGALRICSWPQVRMPVVLAVAAAAGDAAAAAAGEPTLGSCWLEPLLLLALGLGTLLLPRLKVLLVLRLNALLRLRLTSMVPLLLAWAQLSGRLLLFSTGGSSC